MAQNLAVSTELGRVKAIVRERVGALSEQDSLIVNLELVDIIHYAVQAIRIQGGAAFNDFYRRRKDDLTFTGSNPLYTASIAALNIFDLATVTLYHATLGDIPIIGREQFNWTRANRTAATIGTTRGVASIYLTTATPAVLTVELFTNAAAAPSSVQVSYAGNPVKVTVDADTIDVPEGLIPAVLAEATEMTLKRLGRGAQ